MEHFWNTRFSQRTVNHVGRLMTQAASHAKPSAAKTVQRLHPTLQGLMRLNIGACGNPEPATPPVSEDDT